jgi:thiol-disulfide isomerase/thioredoxin
MACSSRPLPDLQVSRLDGEPFRTAELSGQPAWLEFWSPGDPASLQRIRDLPEIVEKFAGAPGRFTLVAVVVAGTSEETRQVLEGYSDLPFTVVLDSGTLSRELGVRLVPTTIWVQPDGRWQRVRQGYAEPELLAREIASRIDGFSRPALP